MEWSYKSPHELPRETPYLNITNTKFSDNSAGRSGSALYAHEYVEPAVPTLNHARLYITNSTFNNHFPMAGKSRSRNLIWNVE